MKTYKVYLTKELTYAELIAYAYCFGEIIVTQSDLKLDNAARFYFKDGHFSTDLEASFESEPKKYKVLIPYAEGSWMAIKSSVKELCLTIAGQDCLQPFQSDPMKLDYYDILEEAAIFDGNDPLMILNGCVCDRCTAFIYNNDFPLPSRYIVDFNELDKAIRKWEKH